MQTGRQTTQAGRLDRLDRQTGRQADRQASRKPCRQDRQKDENRRVKKLGFSTEEGLQTAIVKNFLTLSDSWGAVWKAISTLRF